MVAPLLLGGLLLSVGVRALGQSPIVSSESSTGAKLLAKAGSSVVICVDGKDWKGVVRAAQDLADDFGRVTGTNGTLVRRNESSSGSSQGLQTCNIIVGSVEKSHTIQALVEDGRIDVEQIEGEWEAFTSTVISHDKRNNGTTNDALVISGIGFPQNLDWNCHHLQPVSR